MSTIKDTSLDAASVPVGDDDDAEMARAADSPKRPRTEGGCNVVTVDLLRQLLGEQQAAIGNTIAKAVSDLEVRQGERLQGIDAELRRQATTVHKLATDVQEESRQRQRQDRDTQEAVKLLQERVQKLENLDGSSASASTATSDERHRTTLVLGGFKRDTKRLDIVNFVQKAIRDLRLQDDVDKECFTTGPRRSFCLLPFILRTGERNDQLRDRMRKVMLAFQTRRFAIPDHDKTLWCVLSKPKAAREKAGHCGAVRAAIYYFSKDKIDEVDSDYGTGTCWLGQSMIASATSKPPDPSHRLHVVEVKECKPWVDLTALSAELQADVTELQEFFTKPDRQ